MYSKVDHLTSEQKCFAEEHHGLVYHFLNSQKLDEDSFYDVVIFAYLQAVKKYDEDSTLRKYAFSTIAWSRMKAAVANYWKSQFCPTRKATVFSLDAPSFSKWTAEWGRCEFTSDDPIKQVESKLMLSQMYARLNKKQRRLADMRMSGAADAEIAARLHTSLEDIARQVNNLQDLLADCI